jgi:hypothetical protein
MLIKAGENSKRATHFDFFSRWEKEDERRHMHVSIIR